MSSNSKNGINEVIYIPLWSEKERRFLLEIKT